MKMNLYQARAIVNYVEDDEGKIKLDNYKRVGTYDEAKSYLAVFGALDTILDNPKLTIEVFLQKFRVARFDLEEPK